MVPLLGRLFGESVPGARSPGVGEVGSLYLGEQSLVKGQARVVPDVPSISGCMNRGLRGRRHCGRLVRAVSATAAERQQRYV